MKILIACEFSGVVREAFRKRGHDAWSCDLLPSEIYGKHYRGDVLKLLDEKGFVKSFSGSGFSYWSPVEFDMMIAFPPCTDLAVSGARWFSEKQKDGRQQKSIEFFLKLANASIEKIAIENPIGIMSTQYRKPDQIIQPWQFGHGETKATCLWLKNLPKLKPTNIVEGREQRIWKMAPGPNRSKERSRIFQGIADAMAEQWG